MKRLIIYIKAFLWMMSICLIPMVIDSNTRLIGVVAGVYFIATTTATVINHEKN